MFERFTDQARRVVVLAQEEARLLNHNFIGTEHLLLGVLHEAEGLAAQALTELGVTLDAVRAEVRSIIGEGERAPTGHIPFTPRAKKVLELSLREALQLGSDYIGTEHLLLGLIREGEGVAPQVLVKLGSSLDEVRETVITLYEQQPPEEREEQSRAQGERAREREESSGVFEPRFPMPGFLARRGFARATSARPARPFVQYTEAGLASVRTPVRPGPVVDRPAESERLLAVLARRERNNVVLVGPSGSGKSALVRGVVQTLGTDRAPAALADAEVIELDLAALRAGAGRIGRRGGPAIALVEDLDLLLRADDLSGGRLVTALASLADADSPLIVTASAEAIEHLEQGFPTLATRFEPVEVAEASGPHTFAVLELLRPALQEFHGVTIEDAALTAAIELAPQLRRARVLPGGAVDLLDAATARAAVARSAVVGEEQVRDAA